MFIIFIKKKTKKNNKKNPHIKQFSILGKINELKSKVLCDIDLKAPYLVSYFGGTTN